MAKKETSPAHTKGPWHIEATPTDQFLISLEDGSTIATVGDGPHEGGTLQQLEANARLVAAAPDGYTLAVSMQNACEEHLSELNEQMSHGREGASDEELDDLQAQIDNWSVLLEKCNAYFAKIYGNAKQQF